ncbi:MAG: hypothetical protein R3C99_16715 [Pirellulaceae bacterium]
MLSAFAPAWLLACAITAAPIEHGTQLVYQGTFDADKGDPFVTRKNFELTVLFTEPAEGDATAYWMLRESGRGGWQWPDRFGRVPVDGNGRFRGDGGPALLYQRPEGNSVVPFALPIAPLDQMWKVGAKWEEGRLTYEVQEQGAINGSAAWRVEAHNPYGRVQTFWVDEQSPVVVASTRRVFIGRGEPHELQYELKDRTVLSAEELAQATATLDQLISLRDALAFQPRTLQVDWDKQQLERLREDLPKIPAAGKPVVLAQVLKDAGEDAKAQKNRTSAVDAMKKNAVGQEIGPLKLTDFTGKPLDAELTKDKVVILHFWSYQDAPLEEPYGQIGYLDFLNRRIDDAPITILGVVVNDRLAEGQRASAVQGAKRLRSFMNLGYTIVLDDGALKQLGDPRVADAKLPLFVVIGRDGKVLEYHVGNYEVDRDRGLKQLEDVAKSAANEK